MTLRNEGLRVSAFSRVLAWVFVLCGALIVSLAAIQIFMHKKWIWGLGETLLLAFGVLCLCPLFLFVALRGRSPRWLASIENIYSQEASRREVRTTAKPFRSLVPAVASIVFGLFLIYFGNQIGLFAGANRWFAMIVFALAWLIIATLMWRYFRSSPAGGGPAGSGNDFGRKTESQRSESPAREGKS